MGFPDFVDRFAVQVASAYTAGGTTLVLTSATGLPSGACNFDLLIDAEGANTAEVFHVTSRSGTSCTGTGAQANTSASNHAIGAVVRGTDMTAARFAEILPTDANLSTSDITTNNASTSKHGFVPKLPNDATKFYDGTGAYSTPAGGDMVKLSQNTLGSAAATVTFSSIPGSYSNLMITISGGCSAAGAQGVYMQYNGDTAANYTRQYVLGYSGDAHAIAGQTVSNAQAAVAAVPGTTELSGSAIVITIPNYAGATFKKHATATSSYMSGSSAASAIQMTFIAHFWNSASAISSVTFGLLDGSNFVAGSVFTLYGLK